MIIMKTKCKPKNIGEILSESDITSDGELRTTYTSEFPNWNKSFDEIGKELGECLESYNTPTEKVVSITVVAGEPSKIVTIYVGDDARQIYQNRTLRF